MIEDLGHTRDRVRTAAQEALGLGGEATAAPLREGMRRAGGWYPLVALSLLALVDELPSYALVALGPEIGSSLGIGPTAVGLAVVVKTVALSTALLPFAVLVQRKARRAFLSVGAAFGWGVTTAVAGLAMGFAWLVAVLAADGAARGSVRTLHRPLLMDWYPPQVRIRVDAFYRGAGAVGAVAATMIVTIAVVTGASWRTVFLGLGAISLVGTSGALALRDPGFGRWDTGRVRGLVRTGAMEPERPSEASEGETGLTTFEIVRRLLLIPTLRRILGAQAVLGMMMVPLYPYLFFFLEERWGMGPGVRGAVFAALAAAAIPALAWVGPRADGRFRTEPGAVLRWAATAQLLGSFALALGAFAPLPGLGIVVFCGAFAMFALLAPAMNVPTLSVVAPRMRPHAAALMGLAFAVVGGFGGLLLLAGIDVRFGTAVAIGSLAVPGLVAARLLWGAGGTVGIDLDRLVHETLDDEGLISLRRRGVRLPVLACRNIDFSYGQLQVLFDVSLTIEEGEMVALLGTNGSGKSTLLRVISGLGFPTRGTVRFEGEDITYLDPERRFGLGISQIPGRRAVFGGLSVTENLRIFGHTQGSALERGIEVAYGSFPQLFERRNHPAATLSGGEQQMLALAKALIVRPKLLLVDELSLGLAPKIVSELLEMVRSINAEGTAVVLVEQSVNVALTFVDHAYFMEKGEIRFDGRARDLLERKDLLRSVFLEGAARDLGE